MIGIYRQQLIEHLIAKGGEHCAYCKVKVHKNWMETERHENDATVDHIIPKAKGGTNKRENLALACRRCNNAKSDRSVADFLAHPYHVRGPSIKKAPRIRNIKFVPVPKPAGKRPGDYFDEYGKIPRGTLAWMKAHGDEPLPRGATLRKFQPPARVVPKMSAAETAKFLRESAERKGKSWPLA